MNKLSDMPNIGGVLEKLLMEVAIESPEELVRAGSKEAFVKIKLVDGDACFSKLCALEGAVEGIRWHNLSEDKKKELKSFMEALG